MHGRPNADVLSYLAARNLAGQEQFDLIQRKEASIGSYCWRIHANLSSRPVRGSFLRSWCREVFRARLPRRPKLQISVSSFNICAWTMV
jgi:hypothetical protein